MFTRKLALVVVAGTLFGAGAVQADSVFPESAIEYPQFERSKNAAEAVSAERDSGQVAGEKDPVFPASAIEYPQFEYSQKPAYRGAAAMVASRVNGKEAAGGTFPASAIE